MRSDWFSCDGKGHVAGIGPEVQGQPSSDSTARPPGPQAGRISRRGFLATGALASLWWAGRDSAIAQLTFAADRNTTERDILVVVFLRGGMDGLNAVVPYQDADYYKARPTLAIPGVRNSSAAAGDRVIDLDGFFGLNPAMASLQPVVDAGHCAFVHAVGSMDQTRSHFEAMNTMERGLPDLKEGAASGWLARHLATTEPTSSSPIRAISLTSIMPDSLRGGTQAIAIPSLDDFRLVMPGAGPNTSQTFREALREMYGGHKDLVSDAGSATLTMIDTLNRLDPEKVEASRKRYPSSDLGEALRQVAVLIKAELGLEVACVEKGGWDTHLAQGSTSGWLASYLKEVADSLRAFHDDLGARFRGVQVVVMTEFGRRVQENSGLGTDHGRASCMMLLGETVRAGKVHARWPGLRADQLEEPGDLRVTTDYRDVLAEVLGKRTGNRSLDHVFPGYQPSFAGVLN